MGMLIYVCNKDISTKHNVKKGVKNNDVRKNDFKKLYNKHSTRTCFNTGNQFFLERNIVLITAKDYGVAKGMYH